MFILDILLDTLKDSIKMLPFILVTYIIIEVVERKAKFAKNGQFLSGKYAPVLGGLVGIFPQCGFSVMSAKLYEKDIIRLGTLLTVFITTSDEAFAILLASENRLALVPLLIIKLLFGITVGLIVNFLLGRKKLTYKKTDANFEHEEICNYCHTHDEHGEESSFVKSYIINPLLHSLQTYAFIFIVLMIFSFLIGENGLVSEENFFAFMNNFKYLEPFIAGLIGIIPNCASSVFLTTAYINNVISFGSLFAGLSVNAGVGLAILFKNTKKIKRNLAIVATLYALSVLMGIIIIIVTANIL